MLILFVLLTQIVIEAVPVFQEQGFDFLTGTIGSDPASQGIWPGLFGSIFIGVGVVIIAIPLGSGGGDLPRGICVVDATA